MAIVTAVSFVCLIVFFWMGVGMRMAYIDTDDWRFNTVCYLIIVSAFSFLLCAGYYIYKVLS